MTAAMKMSVVCLLCAECAHVEDDTADGGAGTASKEEAKRLV